MTVRFYDSLYSSLSTYTEAQIAAVVGCSDKQIEIVKQRTQFQKGAIAFAVDLCMGREPVGIRYYQSRMRSHLIKCFQKEFLTPQMPVKKS